MIYTKSRFRFISRLTDGFVSGRKNIPMNSLVKYLDFPFSTFILPLPDCCHVSSAICMKRNHHTSIGVAKSCFGFRGELCSDSAAEKFPLRFPFCCVVKSRRNEPPLAFVSLHSSFASCISSLCSGSRHISRFIFESFQSRPGVVFV